MEDALIVASQKVPKSSGFCLEASKQELIDFKNLKAGEYGVYPCIECGTAIEGIFGDEDVCSVCAPKRRDRIRTNLLHRVLSVYGARVSGTKAEIDLLREIQEELR